MSKTSRRKFTAEFKAKVCIEAIKEQQTLEVLSKKYDLHPFQINAYKKDFLTYYSTVFDKDVKSGAEGNGRLIEALYAQIGDLKVANDFLKKSYCEIP